MTTGEKMLKAHGYVCKMKEEHHEDWVDDTGKNGFYFFYEVNTGWFWVKPYHVSPDGTLHEPCWFPESEAFAIAHRLKELNDDLAGAADD